MKRMFLAVALAGLGGAGCGREKASPPTGLMTPPGPGAEQEGGGRAKGKTNANTAGEK